MSPSNWSIFSEDNAKPCFPFDKSNNDCFLLSIYYVPGTWWAFTPLDSHFHDDTLRRYPQFTAEKTEAKRQQNNRSSVAELGRGWLNQSFTLKSQLFIQVPINLRLKPIPPSTFSSVFFHAQNTPRNLICTKRIWYKELENLCPISALLHPLNRWSSWDSVTLSCANDCKVVVIELR